MIMMARDDPMIGEQAIPVEEAPDNPNVLLAITKYGGHLGYYENFFTTEQYFPKVAIEYFNHFRKDR